MIPREAYSETIRAGLAASPIVALLGPRQCGKTTLARLLSSEFDQTEFFDLENPGDLASLSGAPLDVLSRLEGLVIIDEIQRRPELFEILRVLADRPNRPANFLILGSAAPRLVKGASESLAGRVRFVDLTGFDMWEVGLDSLQKLWHRGGFPRAFLAETDQESYLWKEDFIRSFLQRDIPELGINIPAETLRRFWVMVAHFHGQVWNAAEFARSLGAAEATARRYLDILSGAYMVRQLPPWFENIKKRQVKSPRVYIRDTGLLHNLLSLQESSAIQKHPKLGASWEGFVIEQVITAARTHDVYFWATHSGAKLDLLLFRNGKRLGIEVKYMDGPKTTKSMRIAIADLGLDHLYVVYPGERTFKLDDDITALSVRDISRAVGT
ncbi:MAG: ATP-binding protein [Planctomycetota bacterium]|nr:ATP-binding protein [Planctomycetota bacterium]